MFNIAKTSAHRDIRKLVELEMIKSVGESVNVKYLINISGYKS